MNRDRPPPRNGKARARSLPRRLGPTGSDENQKSTRRVTDKNIGRYPKFTERRPTLADAHLPGYLRFLSRELRGRDPDIIGRKFLSEAKLRYKQFLRSGDLDLRRLTWSAIQLCARHLEKEASQ
jgi:hypothetical protein